MSESLADGPLLPLQSCVPARAGFLRSFIAGNYLYVLSALFFMLGSYILMRSTAFTGSAFTRTLKTFVLFQAYEVAVIAVAVFIVRYFRRLGDAFTLLMIELVLLLDPTFFSNAFLTTGPIEGLRGESLAVCGGSLALAGVKLLILQSLLEIRLTGPAWAALLIAATGTWLGEAPMNGEGGYPHRAAWCYAVGWVPLLVAAVMPLHSPILIRSTEPDFISPTQANWLPRLVLYLPLVITTAHYIETGQVYTVKFYGFYVSPVLLAAAMLVLRRGVGSGFRKELPALDLLVAAALLFSIPPSTAIPKSLYLGYRPAPEFVKMHVPIALCVGAVVGFYAYAYVRTRQRRLVMRLGVLAAAGFAVFLSKIGFLELVGRGIGVAGETGGTVVLSVLRFIRGVLVGSIEFVSAHPHVVFLPLWLLVGAAALTVRRFGLWVAFILFSLAYGPSLLPGQYRWFFEALQLALAAILVLFHVYGDPRNERTTVAVVIAVIGLLRFFAVPTELTAAVVAIEFAAFLSAGSLLRFRPYVVVAVLQALAFSPKGVLWAMATFSPAFLFIGLGMILFALALVVTFQKQRILAVLDKPGKGGV